MSDLSSSTNLNPRPLIQGVDWDVAIIIVAYEGDAWIPDCLESLKSSTQINGLVILIDNKDNTGLTSGKIGSLTIHCLKTPHPMGFADANNFALMKVPPSVPNICFLNQDTISQKNWLEEALRCLDKNPKIGALSSMLKNYQGSDWDRDFKLSLKSQSGYKEDWLQPTHHPESAPFHLVDCIPATAMIVRTDVIKRTGPFDPLFGSYYEDYDLCMRIRKLGFHLAICPQSTIFHYSGSISQSPEARKRRSRWVIRNRTIHKIRKEEGPRWMLIWNLLIVAGSKQIIRSILRTPSSSHIKSVIMAYVDLLQILPRLFSKKIDQKFWNQFLNTICWENFGSTPFECNENSSR